MAVGPKHHKKMGPIGAAGWGLIDFGMRKMEGESTGSAAVKAGATTAAWWAFEPVMMGLMVGDMVKGGLDYASQLSAENLAYGGMHAGQEHISTASFQDTEQMATLRQRNLKALQDSKMNARMTLGNEARMLHR